MVYRIDLCVQEWLADTVLLKHCWLGGGCGPISGMCVGDDILVLRLSSSQNSCLLIIIMVNRETQTCIACNTSNSY